MIAALVCSGEVPVWLTPTLGESAGLWRAEFQAGTSCAAQQLTFPAAPRSGQLWQEQIALVRAP